nr:hypothetical protein [Microtetraspora sp. NBRC 16547]
MNDVGGDEHEISGARFDYVLQPVSPPEPGRTADDVEDGLLVPVMMGSSYRAGLDGAQERRQMGRVRVAGVESDVADEPGCLRRIAVESVAARDPDLLAGGDITHDRGSPASKVLSVLATARQG